MLILILIPLLTFYVAWNLGANDVANSMGTSVGSKVITLRQALLIAGILEFTGAVVFGKGVSETLATKIANPNLFSANPQLLLLGMISVLLSCGLWLQIATSWGLPVASSHTIVGAIAGFSWVAAGISAVDWIYIGRICLAWLITPLLSGLVAALFYSLLRYFILQPRDSVERLHEWIPWLSVIVFSLFGVIVLPTFFTQPFFTSLPLPTHDFSLASGAIAAVIFTITSWNYLEQLSVKENNQDASSCSTPETEGTLESLLGRFQILSACFVAFAHGSNDVGNAIAPLAAIAYIINTDSVPFDNLPIPTWILILGGLGLVAGLAIQGKKVIATVGEGIISLQPSSGFCAEIATATTILFASRLGLPVSTSHALVGSVIGIGILHNWQNVRWQTMQSVILAWIITLPIAAIIGAICFATLLFFTSNYHSELSI